MTDSLEFAAPIDPNWTCPKCESPRHAVDEIRAVGGFFTKLIDVQSKKFESVSCKECGYTEFYTRPTSTTSNVIDFLAGD